MRRITEFFLDNLEQYLKGEKLKNVVDKQLGFNWNNRTDKPLLQEDL